jgi:hypothetical protein
VTVTASAPPPVKPLGQQDDIGFGTLLGLLFLPGRLLNDAIYNPPTNCHCNALGVNYGSSLPPLRIVHKEPPLQQSASYQQWNKKSTQEIIDSLKEGQKEPLTVYPDGAVAQGNTRITILMERGVDVNSLPRVDIDYAPGIDILP